MVEPEQTSAFAATLKAGQVFFDIGANAGYYTILGARLVGSHGTVVAFEPAIRNVAYLYRHTVLNRLSNVIILSVACADAVSLVSFASGVNCATGHVFAGRCMENGARELLIPVPAVTMDAVVEQMGVAPDVIKIDVEGAELSVLKGAQLTLRKAKPKLFLSTHSVALRAACLEYGSTFGYTFEILSHDKNDPSEFLATCSGT